jgi:hypothetical protein
MTTEQIKEKVIIYTNNRLVSWYLSAKADYGIIGSGKLRLTEDMAIVEYVENGEKKTWSTYYHISNLKQNKISWLFDCWIGLE